jgi:hypothetical protein
MASFVAVPEFWEKKNIACGEKARAAAAFTPLVHNANRALSARPEVDNIRGAILCAGNEEAPDFCK